MSVIRYPWDRWFRRREFILSRGVEYDIPSYVMAQQIRNRATQCGYTATIRISDDKLQVRVERKETIEV